MYLLPVSLWLNMALTSSSPICYSFETPPSCFKMNIKTNSKCFEETSVPFFWKSGHVQERVFHTSATKTSPRLCREYLKFPLWRYIYNNLHFQDVLKICGSCHSTIKHLLYFLCFFGGLPPEFLSSCMLHLLETDTGELDKFMCKSKRSVPNCSAKFSFLRCSLAFRSDSESSIIYQNFHFQDW